MFNKIKKQYLALLVLVPVIAITYSVMNNPITLQCDNVNKGTTVLSKNFTRTYTPIESFGDLNYFQFNPKCFKSNWDKKTNKFPSKSKKVYKYNKEFASYSLDVPFKLLNEFERNPKDPSETNFANLDSVTATVDIDRVAGRVSFSYLLEDLGTIEWTFSNCSKVSVKKLPELPKTKF